MRNDLCYSPNITVVITRDQRCTWQHVWAEHKCTQGLVRKPEGECLEDVRLEEELY